MKRHKLAAIDNLQVLRPCALILQPGTTSAEEGHTAVKEGSSGGERPDLAPKKLFPCNSACICCVDMAACVCCYGNKIEEKDCFVFITDSFVICKIHYRHYWLHAMHILGRAEGMHKVGLTSACRSAEGLRDLRPTAVKPPVSCFDRAY